MEERIVDDEFGRKIRLKKTKEGYVDATDELAPDTDEEDLEDLSVLLPEELRGEEDSTFFVPTYHTEDDEELVDLSPAEAERVRKEKAERLMRRKEAYKKACEEGEKLLQEGSFRAAELSFEKALRYDEVATEASVGYWRAKTMEFTDPDVLVEEYLKDGMDELESDLGVKATNYIKYRYKDAFEKRYQELVEQEKPYLESVESKQTARRETLTKRLQKTGLLFGAFVLVLAGILTATIYTLLQNFSTPDNRFVVPTIVLGCVSFVAFIATLVVTNKFFNASRMYRMNENLSSTDEGKALLEIREYKDLYEEFLCNVTEQTLDDEEMVDEEWMDEEGEEKVEKTEEGDVETPFDENVEDVEFAFDENEV